MSFEAEIRTTAGGVRGKWQGAVAVFRGIPYAQPPVGPRRFAAPVAVRAWDGVRDAFEFGPPAPQAGSTVAHDGNCLTLNVWSPDLGPAGLPVMVWIHGGAYREGSSGNPHYDGATLAAAGVVMVSLNYRVGVEGFAHIAGAPDNRGILDQALALRWVQDNVTAFGGDPGRVTVFGQSAGAGCVAALLAMPKAQGLFQRAIAQSVPGTYFSAGLAAAISTRIAEEAGARATVDDLARVDSHALVGASDAVLRRMPSLVDSWGPMALTPTPFSPVVDGDVLPCAPWRALANGSVRGVELLIGHTRDEYRLFNPLRGREVADDQVTTALRHLAPRPDGPGDYRAVYAESTPAQLYETVHADWLFRMPSLHLADAHATGGGPTWVYELCWSFNEVEGSSHCLDFLLVFGTLTPAEVRTHPAAHPTAAGEIRQVAHAMRTDWLAFATTGNPGWTPYDPDVRATRVYAATPTTAPYPEERSRFVWATHRFDTLDLPGTG
ncbi:carboxylesterase/lipase family protein [Nocardia wallacei]|uniref:carboxylesterase/lipase family protein n=1 Tax=Nocardia wallacei TaxID=480035 RepID=UPI002454DF45|nr:carboxylesterase family protein [Nocardia wallacei]